MNEHHTPSPRPSSATIFAWTVYDWANSAYSTLLITVVLHYMQKIVLPGKHGAAALALGIGASMLLAAILSPVVGAMADANCSKRRWLAGTAFCGSSAAVAMAVIPPNYAWAIVAMFVLTGMYFELSLVPYNGFLPEITDDKTVNRVSARGFAMGYIGGSVPLVIAWLIVRFGKEIGVPSDADQHRLGILLLGLWWGLFSLPAVLILRDRGERSGNAQSFFPAIFSAAGQAVRSLANVRRYRVLALFLLGFLFYNDGVQTVITQSNTMAVKELKFSLDELFWLVLVIQLAALPGSLLIGWVADRIGPKPTLLFCLAVWAGLLIAAMFIETKTAYWIMGIVLALVLGGTQSVSRAIMSMLTPPRHAAEFFGFFNLSGKAASVLGPTQFGAVLILTGNARWAAASLLLFFAIGFALLSATNIAAGQRQAQESA